MYIQLQISNKDENGDEIMQQTRIIIIVINIDFIMKKVAGDRL